MCASMIGEGIMKDNRIQHRIEREKKKSSEIEVSLVIFHASFHSCPVSSLPLLQIKNLRFRTIK